MNPAIENLKINQRQLDMDGCEVGVSRQALDEVLTAFDNLLWAAEKMRGVRMLDNLTVLELQNVDAAIKAANN
jgi:hypothetical protein